MKTFFCADTHFAHANIIKFCNRPFKDVDDMNSKLINNWNQRVKQDDIVYNLGDWCFRGGKEGGSNKAHYWEKKLHGKIIHIAGNHDINNGVKSILMAALLEFGGYQVFAQHRPPMMRPEVPEFCDFALCGHIHNLWKFQYNTEDPNIVNVPIINVGVDVWNYRPVSMEEIIAFYNKILKGTAK